MNLTVSRIGGRTVEKGVRVRAADALRGAALRTVTTILMGWAPGLRAGSCRSGRSSPR
jgi:hypothetical protein